MLAGLPMSPCTSDLQESFQHHSPGADHTGQLVLCQGLPAAASGASFLPAQVTFDGQTCLCGAKKRPTRVALPGSVHPQHWRFPATGARMLPTQREPEEFSAQPLIFHPPSNKHFRGKSQESPHCPFTELGSGLV